MIMSCLKHKDRINSSQEASDYNLLARLPLIICVNGRGYFITWALMEKPYCPKFAECILSTILSLCSVFEDALFAYQFTSSRLDTFS